jgi:hypothetical protein
VHGRDLLHSERHGCCRVEEQRQVHGRGVISFNSKGWSALCAAGVPCAKARHY